MRSRIPPPVEQRRTPDGRQATASFAPEVICSQPEIAVSRAIDDAIRSPRAAWSAFPARACERASGRIDDWAARRAYRLPNREYWHPGFILTATRSGPRANYAAKEIG